ncbi:DinB family protein [Riemerella anatipestifer]|nr:DinB family protein [Riemerella anatipestifer]
MNDFQKYLQRYFDLIPEGDWLMSLDVVGQETIDLYKTLKNGQEHLAYAHGKWSFRVLLQHLIDTEKIFNYRALRFSRGDAQQLVGFDENHYAEQSQEIFVPLSILIEEFETVRKMSLLFFGNLSGAVLDRRGVANGNSVSVEEIGRLILGHNIHHLNIIKERYTSLL